MDGVGAPRHLPPIHSQLWKFPANPARVGVSHSLGEGVGLGSEPYFQANLKRKGGRGARTPKHNTFSRSQLRRVSSRADGPTPLEPPEARPARCQSTGRGAPPAAVPCPPATGPGPVLLPPGPPAECSGPLRLQGRAASPARPASTATPARKAGRPPRRKSPQPTDPGRPPPRRPKGRVVWRDGRVLLKEGVDLL
jgi:hypothetical protein